MPLKSPAFADSIRLQRCAVQDAAHVTLNDRGDHVSRIQQALIQLDSSAIAQLEIANCIYGPTTAKAVLGYKTRRNIVNKTYQSAPDNIVGKMTIVAMDADLLAAPPGPGPSPQPTPGPGPSPAPGPGPSPQPTPTPGPPTPPPRPFRTRSKFLPVPYSIPAGFRTTISSNDPFDGFDDLSEVKGPITRSWQMVPVGGTREIFIFDPGIQTGRPVFRLSVSSSIDQIPADHICTMTEGRPEGSMRRVILKGIGFGGAFLNAVRVTNNNPEAILQIAVLMAKPVRFVFGVIGDSRHVVKSEDLTKVNVSQFAARVAKIWGDQANIQPTATEPVAIQVTNNFGDMPSDAELTRQTPMFRSILSKTQPLQLTDRAVFLIWSLEPDENGRTNGFTPFIPGNTIFLRADTAPSARTLSHEFGHSLGLEHRTGDERNLMTSVNTDDSHVDLKKTQILPANFALPS